MVLSCLIQQNGGSDAKSDGKLKPIVKIESDSEDDTATTSTSDALQRDTRNNTLKELSTLRSRYNNAVFKLREMETKCPKENGRLEFEELLNLLRQK